MNKIVELERKGEELTSDIDDVFHAAKINFKALRTESEHNKTNVFSDEFDYLQNLLQECEGLLKQRASQFMGYMIVRQIQDEEARVRRERLEEYQQKIYDQKRIITDKQTFFENLLRPKRKKMASQTTEQFQQVRVRERENEERTKSQQLNNELMQVQALRKLLLNQGKERRLELECTKSSSLSQVNITGLSLGEVAEVATERVVPFDDRSNKENRPTHVRSSSMQAEMNCILADKIKKEDTEKDMMTCKNLAIEIIKLKQKNEQLHKIFDQAALSLKFKKSICLKFQKEYKQMSNQLTQTKKQNKIVQMQQKWRYQRVNSPLHSKRKRADSK